MTGGLAELLNTEPSALPARLGDADTSERTALRTLLVLARVSDRVAEVNPRLELELYEVATDLAAAQSPPLFGADVETSTQEMVSEAWQLAFTAEDEIQRHLRRPDDPQQRVLWASGCVLLAQAVSMLDLEGIGSLRSLLVDLWHEAEVPGAGRIDKIGSVGDDPSNDKTVTAVTHSTSRSGDGSRQGRTGRGVDQGGWPTDADEAVVFRAYVSAALLLREAEPGGVDAALVAQTYRREHGEFAHAVETMLLIVSLRAAARCDTRHLPYAPLVGIADLRARLAELVEAESRVDRLVFDSVFDRLMAALDLPATENPPTAMLAPLTPGGSVDRLVCMALLLGALCQAPLANFHVVLFEEWGRTADRYSDALRGGLAQIAGLSSTDISPDHVRTRAIAALGAPERPGHTVWDAEATQPRLLGDEQQRDTRMRASGHGGSGGSSSSASAGGRSAQRSSPGAIVGPTARPAHAHGQGAPPGWYWQAQVQQWHWFDGRRWATPTDTQVARSGGRVGPLVLVSILVSVGLGLAIVAALVLAANDSGESAGDAPGPTTAANTSQAPTEPLRTGLPNGIPDFATRGDLGGFPYPAPGEVAYVGSSGFTLIVVAPVYADEVVNFLADEAANGTWVLADQSPADPSIRRIALFVFESASDPDQRVTLEVYDPSGGEQLGLIDQFGFQGPWIDVTIQGAA